MSTSGDVSRVRPMIESDLTLVQAWRNHPDVRNYMYTTHEITKQEHRAWFERASADPHRHLLIYEQHGDPLGFVNFGFSDPQGGRAEWGFYLAPDAPGGSGQSLGRSALQHAFSVLGAHKICGEALAFNSRSIAFHLRMGFQEEGILRAHHFDGSGYHDVHLFGLLDREWTERLTHDHLPS